ncbi:MAG: hypothetical protein HOL05_02660, partial [Nitrospinaceae bacterium]|nr:hypothetical protein [Nitrospinaceae bacterium]
QGRENVKRFLKENPDIYNDIEGRLRATFAPKEAEAEAEPETTNGVAEHTVPDAEDKVEAEKVTPQ